MLYPVYKGFRIEAIPGPSGLYNLFWNLGRYQPKPKRLDPSRGEYVVAAWPNRVGKRSHGYHYPTKPMENLGSGGHGLVDMCCPS